MTPPRTRLSHDQRLVLLALGALAPSAILALVLLWTGDHHPRTQWTLTVTLAVLAAGFLASLRARVIMPLQTVANLLSALREGDFSIRARGSRRADPLYDLHAEVNALAEMLRGQRLDSLEATALLRKVMAELDVAVFTFDERRRLQLVNHAGERLLGAPAERLLDRHAAELEMDQWLDSGGPRIEPIALPGATGRWEVRHTPFRQRGLPHHLVVLTDVSKPLRDEERAAWQRLIRVLGHELNNSLAPIKSIAGSLGSLVQREPRPSDWEVDLGRGLGVIATRAEALSRFMAAYAQLARLPAPSPRPVRVGALVERVARLDQRRPVAVERRARPDHRGRRRPDRAAADQPAQERDRRGVRDGRRRQRRLVAGAGLDAAGLRAHRRRRRPRPLEHQQPVRAVLHHQAGRIRASAWCSAGRSPRRTTAR